MLNKHKIEKLDYYCLDTEDSFDDKIYKNFKPNFRKFKRLKEEEMKNQAQQD